MVNTDGRFKSFGERAFAYALGVTVDNVQPGTTLQSTSFVGVLWANQTVTTTPRKQRHAEDPWDICAAVFRAFVQLDLSDAGIAGPADASDPRVLSLAASMKEQVEDAAAYGALKEALVAVDFNPGNICIGPKDFSFSTETLEVHTPRRQSESYSQRPRLHKRKIAAKRRSDSGPRTRLWGWLLARP